MKIKFVIKEPEGNYLCSGFFSSGRYLFWGKKHDEFLLFEKEIEVMDTYKEIIKNNKTEMSDTYWPTTIIIERIHIYE